ncbi:MAG: tRNA (adenosine(37)-N6)-threonylcarbamoyltransferase complex transferase subunit TsaD [Bacteroidales bacterium]|jgi:N6-L-threonylcarbamoyladenine synthase|nr:tRNA (adenosine(37)-N6)-threonylcarbamoyltransferase complex transferase subunit TsaD [Bacteroidales bacterium]
MPITILAIESSCDDTSAAIVEDGFLLSNLIAGQEVHRSYGGVVPELASRAHQANIVPVVDQAIKNAGIRKEDIDAVSFTRGPGLLGSLLVGASFAKGLALALAKPLIEVNHLQAHILSHWLKEKGGENRIPALPFLCLLVSGGHTQLVVVDRDMKLKEIGSTIDDAAGEAFDKCAKLMGMPYPGGPLIDKLAAGGDPGRFKFTRPRIEGLDYSFSGLKTNFLYFLRDAIKENEEFIEENRNDLCASLQKTIVEILTDKLIKAAASTGIREIGIAGGVAANSGLRDALDELGKEHGWNIYLPKLGYTTDNAAMIAITGYFKYLEKDFSSQDTVPLARFNI